MSSKLATWMPLYIGDYLRDTLHLTTEEHGAYFLLICAYWIRGGPLLDDDGWLASITKLCRPDWENIRPTLEGFFTIEDNFWHHKRIDEELEKANALLSARSKGGKVGMANRWHNSVTNSVIAEPITKGLLEDNTRGVPSPSHSTSTEVRSKAKAITDARVIIHFLNEQAGRSYRETEINFKLICARLAEVKGDVDGVKRMIVRQCARWKGDPKMDEYLRVTTLFGKEKFGQYYDTRDLPAGGGAPAADSIISRDIARGARRMDNFDTTLPD